MTAAGVDILVATHTEILRVDPQTGSMAAGHGLPQRPTAVAWDPLREGRAWAGTRDDGVHRSDDGGRSWTPVGPEELRDARIMAILPSPARPHRVWVGTEPSAVWRSDDGGRSWERMDALAALSSSSEWAFPPRPETHHVRWIAAHPADPDRLWVAIEAGALVRTTDGGESWDDRVPGGPYDTHELAVHPDRPDVLRVSAGDGYYESHDAGATWEAPRNGLEVGYLRSVAVDPGDPDTVVVSASSGPRSAYVAGRSDGRLYRRTGSGRWERVRGGWPEPPSTIAPLLAAGLVPGQLWAADERGVHRSDDGGRAWNLVAAFDTTPDHLRGLAVGPAAATDPSP